MSLVTYEALLQAPYRDPDEMLHVPDGLTPDWIWWANGASTLLNQRDTNLSDPVVVESKVEGKEPNPDIHPESNHQPASGPSEREILVCVVHGGCWSADFDRTHLRGLCSYLSARGLSVVLPEYRRCGQAGAGWPGTFRDVVSAIQRSRHLARQRGARLIVFGHSAGGHLALWLNAKGLACGAETWIDQEALRIDAVIALAPITDLELFGQGNGSCQVMVEALISSGEMIQARDVSPRFGSSVTREVVVAGGLDPIVFEDQTLAYARAKGCEFIALEGAGHFDALLPGHVACARLTAILMGSSVQPNALNKGERSSE